MNLPEGWQALPLSNENGDKQFQLFFGNEIFCPYMSMGISSAIFGVTHKEGGPFGAVIVRNNEVIAVAHNTVYKDFRPAAHAEANAIEMAIKNISSATLEDCVLYATAEPCPMCRAGIFQAGIKTVYVGVTYQISENYGFDDAIFQEELSKSWENRVIPSYKNLFSETESKIFNLSSPSWIAKHVTRFIEKHKNEKFPDIFYLMMGKEVPSERMLSTTIFQEDLEMFDTMLNPFYSLSSEQKKLLQKLYWSNLKYPLRDQTNVAGIVREGEPINEIDFAFDILSNPLSVSAIDTCITKLCKELQKVDLCGYTLYSYHAPTPVECGIIMWSRLSHVVVVNPKADMQSLSDGRKISDNNDCTFIRGYMSKGCETVFSIWKEFSGALY